MKIKVSKVMAKELAKAFKNREGYKDCKVEYIEMGAFDFSMQVDASHFAHEVDWDMAKSKFKVIRVLYPYDWYANPRYITTKDLDWAFEHCDKTYEGFIDKAMELMEC